MSTIGEIVLVCSSMLNTIYIWQNRDILIEILKNIRKVKK